jgi:hypothetical protein
MVVSPARVMGPPFCQQDGARAWPDRYGPVKAAGAQLDWSIGDPHELEKAVPGLVFDCEWWFGDPAEIQACGLETFEQLAGALRVRAAPRRALMRCLGTFSNPDRAHDQHVVGVGQKPQRGQLGPQLFVIAALGRVVPGLRLHMRIRVRGLGPAQCGFGVTAGDLNWAPLIARESNPEIVADFHTRCRNPTGCSASRVGAEPRHFPERARVVTLDEVLGCRAAL